MNFLRSCPKFSGNLVDGSAGFSTAKWLIDADQVFGGNTPAVTGQFCFGGFRTQSNITHLDLLGKLIGLTFNFIGFATNVYYW
jgi:hypothetical protein